MIRLSIRELDPPSLQFGGAGGHSDPKVGLDHAGPFDLRFGAGRQASMKVGIIGPGEFVDATKRWLERCARPIPVLGEPNLLRKPFPGFTDVFRTSLTLSDS